MADMSFLKDLGIAAACTAVGGVATVIATRRSKKGFEGAVDWIGGLVNNAMKGVAENSDKVAETAAKAIDTAQATAEAVTEAVSQ